MDRGSYEKISDQVMLIANKVVLKMNVVLSYYTNNNRRMNYHQEVEYYSPKANGNVINIKRNFDYYLSIEHMTNKDFIRIGISDMINLQHGLKEAYRFFTDPQYKDLFGIKDGELIKCMHPEPISIYGLPMDKYLKFEPCVYLDFRGEKQMGIRMYLSSQSSFCDISIRNLEAFIYTINTFNLFASAQAMLNYFSKPDMGYNLYSCNTEPEIEDEGNFHGKDGRVPESNIKLSYFDKMSRMED